MGVNGGERDSDGIALARGLLERFLANRSDRTLKAYSTDLEEFARSTDQALDASATNAAKATARMDGSILKFY